MIAINLIGNHYYRNLPPPVFTAQTIPLTFCSF